MMAPKPDWRQMSLLYQSLWRFEPTPVVALNWAVVMTETGRAELALGKLESLETDLAHHQPWHAARAHILQTLGKTREAREAFILAIDTATSSAARKFLQGRLDRLSVPEP